MAVARPSSSPRSSLDEPLSNLDANLREEMRFEIRRFHEAFGITTLTTHDQAEAMVISDRVAVLEAGQVVQIGTAEELREPRTRFVAEFIGKTNLIDAVAEAEPRPGDTCWRSRREIPSLARPWPSPSARTRSRWRCRAPAGSAAHNVFTGIVRWASYLGDAVITRSSPRSGIVLRIAGLALPQARAGQSVRLFIPPASCVPLREGTFD